MLIAIGQMGILAIIAALALVVAGGATVASASEDCGVVQISPDVVMRNVDRITAVVTSAKPDASGLDFIASLMKIVAPTCAWTRSTKATIVGPEGSFEWQEIVARVGNKTVLDLATDPELQALLEAPGKEGVGEVDTILAAMRFAGIDPGKFGL